jgi:hypothetical protein
MTMDISPNKKEIALGRWKMKKNDLIKALIFLNNNYQITCSKSV